jgi:hypothetical protein
VTARDEILAHIDKNGMVARSIPPVEGSEGNPWTETATAFLCLFLRKEISSDEILNYFNIFYPQLSVQGKPGYVHKKFTGHGVVSGDQVTFDDIIGFLLIAKLSNQLEIIDQFIDTAEKDGWIVSNTVGIYFTAVVRPWHVAIYKICHSVRKNSIYSNLLIFMYFVLRGFLRSSFSGIRLDLLMSELIQSKSFLVDLGLYIWRKIILYKHKSFSNVLSSYYEKNDHFIARHFPI